MAKEVKLGPDVARIEAHIERFETQGLATDADRSLRDQLAQIRVQLQSFDVHRTLLIADGGTGRCSCGAVISTGNATAEESLALWRQHQAVERSAEAGPRGTAE